jgi:hypothetical protein
MVRVIMSLSWTADNLPEASEVSEIALQLFSGAVKSRGTDDEAQATRRP